MGVSGFSQDTFATTVICGLDKSCDEICIRIFTQCERDLVTDLVSFVLSEMTTDIDLVIVLRKSSLKADVSIILRIRIFISFHPQRIFLTDVESIVVGSSNI